MRRPWAILATGLCGCFEGWRRAVPATDLHSSLIRAPDFVRPNPGRVGTTGQLSFHAFVLLLREVTVHFVHPPVRPELEAETDPTAGALGVTELAVDGVTVTGTLRVTGLPADGAAATAAPVLTGIPDCQVSGPFAARIGALIGVVVVVTVMTYTMYTFPPASMQGTNGFTPASAAVA